MHLFDVHGARGPSSDIKKRLGIREENYPGGSKAFGVPRRIRTAGLLGHHFITLMLVMNGLPCAIV
jgi:hypothetical protein